MQKHEEDREIADAVQVKTDIPLDEKCPVCGKNLAIKHGRFGEYTACSNYPECKHIKHKTTGVTCPKDKCGGDIIERRSRRGKIFLDARTIPDCDFVLWNRPIPGALPECAAPFTTLKITKRTGSVRYCATAECGFKESMPDPE